MTISDRITIRMNPDLISRIDDWIGAPPVYVSRQEAVRRLVEFALDHQCPFAVDDIGQHTNLANPERSQPKQP